MATCYRHPDRETGVSCSNCGRPICPDCMTTTPVGMRCPECARQKTRVATGPAASLAGTPYVTYGLVVLNVIAFLLTVGSGGGALNGEGSLLSDYGLFGPAVDGGEYYRLVTS